VAAQMGCSQPTPPPASAHTFVFIDQSSSVTRLQRQSWVEPLTRIADGIRPGSTLSVFGIHDRTADAAPLFTGDLPVLPARPTSTQLRTYKDERARFLTKARRAISEALETAVVARTTDVLSVFDRPRDARDRPRLVFVLSDMLHVTRELNLERQSLSDTHIPDLIQSAAQEHNWSPESLTGTRVYVILPSAQVGDRPSVNSRIVLERFYGAVVTALGGRLERFETHLQGGEK
jgi:hypothetical protein